MLQSGMLGTWGGVGAYVAGQLPFGQDPSASDRHIWQICAYVMAALTGLLIIFVLVLIRRIKVSALLAKLQIDLLSVTTDTMSRACLRLYHRQGPEPSPSLLPLSQNIYKVCEIATSGQFAESPLHQE